MRNAFFAELRIKSAQSLCLFIRKRSSIRTPSKVDERVNLLWLAVDQEFAERGCAILDWLSQRLEYLWVGILRCKLQQLCESVDGGEGIAADEVQFAP